MPAADCATRISNCYLQCLDSKLTFAVLIFCNRMKIEARCDRSARSLNIFILAEKCGFRGCGCIQQASNHVRMLDWRSGVSDFAWGVCEDIVKCWLVLASGNVSSPRNNSEWIRFFVAASKDVRGLLSLLGGVP